MKTQTRKTETDIEIERDTEKWKNMVESNEDADKEDRGRDR